MVPSLGVDVQLLDYRLWKRLSFPRVDWLYLSEGSGPDSGVGLWALCLVRWWLLTPVSVLLSWFLQLQSESEVISVRFLQLRSFA